MIIDLGAKVSILASSFYERHLQHLPLCPATVNLRSHNGVQKDCKGCVTATIHIKGKRQQQFTFYIISRGESILGVERFDALGGIQQLGDIHYVIDDPAAAAVAMVDPDMTS